MERLEGMSEKLDFLLRNKESMKEYKPERYMTKVVFLAKMEVDLSDMKHII